MAVNTDPAALAKMASELKNLEKQVQDATRRVRSQLNSAQWNDPVRQNFERLLSDIERSSKGLTQMANEGAKMLKMKEQQLRQFMGR